MPVVLAVLSLMALAAVVAGARWAVTPRLVARTAVRARLRGTLGGRRPGIPAHIKRAVRARDGYRCRGCGMTEARHLARFRQRLHLDHVVAWSAGGASTAGNLQLLCQPCNLRKGAR